MLARLPTPLLAATFLLSAATARFDNDFSPYPRGAQSCLEDADSKSGCNGETVPTMNACLCGNGGEFLTNTARCVGEESPDDVEETYELLEVNCDGSETPMELSEREFISIASEGPTNTPSATSTETSATSTPTDDPPEDEEPPEGLPNGAKIGIAVGATAVGVAAIAVGVFLFLRRRRQVRGFKDESNPMLGGGRMSLPISAFSGRDSGQTAYAPVYQDVGKTSTGTPAWGPESFSTGQTPPMQQQQQQQQHPEQWDHSRPASWEPQGWGQSGWGASGQGYQPVTGGEVMPAAQLAPPPTGSEVYELSSTPTAYRPRGAPAEMPGSRP